MEKYYFISYLWSDMGNNFCNDVINIDPIEWLERVNRGYYRYKNENGKEKNWTSSKYFRLINWIEISKEQYDKSPKMRSDARINLEFSYGRYPF